VDDKELFFHDLSGIYLSFSKLKNSGNESPIANQNFWTPKPRDDVFVHKCGRIGGCVRLDSLGFRLLDQVLGGDHNVSHIF
jgi:hypothetical protein